LKFQAIAEKTAKNLRRIFLLHPVDSWLSIMVHYTLGASFT